MLVLTLNAGLTELSSMKKLKQLTRRINADTGEIITEDDFFWHYSYYNEVFDDKTQQWCRC